MSLLPPSRQRFGRLATKGGRRSLPLGPNFVQFHGVRPIPGDDHEVDFVGQEVGQPPEALPAQTFDPVARDGPSDTPGRDEPQPRLPRSPIRRCDEKNEVPRQDSLPERLNALEIGPSPDASAAIEPQQRLLLVCAHREALASLAASIAKDSLPAPRGHARAKAVRPDAADVVRLVRALHDGDPRWGAQRSIDRPDRQGGLCRGLSRPEERAPDVETVYVGPAALCAASHRCPPDAFPVGVSWGRTKSRNE
jgi:hypothetical protein